MVELKYREKGVAGWRVAEVGVSEDAIGLKWRCVAGHGFVAVNRLEASQQELAL